MAIPAYTPEWEVYFCDIADRPACVSVDLALESLAPIPDTHRAFELVVALQQADADGFPAEEQEWEKLEEIEEAVVSEFQNSLQAVFVGKLLHDGKRIFYFYSGQEALPEVIAANIMQAFPDYTYATNTIEDPNWGLYLDFLFPEPADMQSIKNSRVIRMMQEHGDEQHIPRPVSHLFYFATETDRLAFKNRVEQEGYTFVSESMIEKSPEAPYSLVVSKVESLDEESVYATTLGLGLLAVEFNGTYDGWEAPVIKEND
ncbi:DUF695 domain-containing protein [Pontibacter sp. JH31]|uniref:DUF695 domain-containing protein n=1 Tax=Pontibacter aquaedesilientis TaxID=2766980 RepID=A0ABR7XHZ0_9BACT|nr:DUF695 domain-containing protein [Pontibacter aquaedesilientis]MBD1397576.1 DUF695 domain-containing protein [Pontibacter aquaedesilientis]